MRIVLAAALVLSLTACDGKTPTSPDPTPRRLDLDLVLNNGAGMNFRQSIAANRGGKRVEFFVNGGRDYIFIAYVRGIDGQFLANGGTFTGEVGTSDTLNIERPE